MPSNVRPSSRQLGGSSKIVLGQAIQRTWAYRRAGWGIMALNEQAAPGGDRIAVPAPVRRFRVMLEWDADDRVWVTYVPALGLLSTHGDTREEALDNSREAILGYLEAAAKEGISIPPEAESDVVDLEVATP